MTIVITGATGQLGRLVVEALLDQDVPAEQIVAAGRDLSKLDDLAERGVQVRRIDFDDVDSLRQAFAGAEKVLLVSGTAVGQRIEQHRNAIEAAKESGAKLIAYTSIAGADQTRILLAADHQGTEEILRKSGVPFMFLRNSLYLDNYTGQLASYVQHGSVLGSAGDGRLSAATRADLAQATAAALLREDQAGKIYELGGDVPFTLGELAEEVSAATGTPVNYQDLPVEQYAQVLTQVGLPEPVAAVFADSDLGIARGDLHVTSGDLSDLLGRPATTMREAIRVAAAAAPSDNA